MLAKALFEWTITRSTSYYCSPTVAKANELESSLQHIWNKEATGFEVSFKSDEQQIVFLESV